MDLAADHHVDQLFRRGVPAIQRAHMLAPTQHRDAVGNAEHLLDLMADEDDGLPRPAERLDAFKQALHLLGHQNGGGLVQNDVLRLAVEHLEDLDALALAHRQVAGDAVQIKIEIIFFAGRLDARLHFFLIQNAERAGLLHAQSDVLPHPQLVHQHEVLVHHADAAAQGVQRIGESQLLAVQRDIAAAGRKHAVENIHQCGFAGAVFSHDGVHRAPLNAQVNAAERRLAGKVFFYVVKFNTLEIQDSASCS